MCIRDSGSFEEETVGTISNNTEIFSKDWVEKNGQGEAASVIAEEEGNRYLNASGLLELQSAKTVDAPYTFSVDLRTETPKAVSYTHLNSVSKIFVDNGVRPCYYKKAR